MNNNNQHFRCANQKILIIFQSPSYEYVPGNYKNYNYKTNSYLSGMIQVDDNSSYVTIETNKE